MGKKEPYTKKSLKNYRNPIISFGKAPHSGVSGSPQAHQTLGTYLVILKVP